MTNDEIKNLIQELHISDERKQTLLGKLEAVGISESLVEDLTAAYREADESIRTEYSKEIGELEMLYADAEKDLDNAYQEFETEASANQEEAEDLVKSTNRNLDKIELDETRAKIQD